MKTDPHEEEYAHLTLDCMGPMGDSLARYDGGVVNVFGGIPGEDVIARIYRYRRRRRSHISGMVSEVLAPSPHRIAPPCPYFGPCSGCQWQHIEYSHQLDLKRQAVEAQLARYLELASVPVSPTLPSPQEFNYRNHARFTVRAQGSLGFSNRITRRFVRVDECMLMAPWINEALGGLQGRCAETTGLAVRYGINTGESLIQPTLKNPEIDLPTGQTHYREELFGHRFRVASPSFFQVNTWQTERLVDLVRERLDLTVGSLLVDAYAGVGTFAVLFAEYARKVIAIEDSASAVKDAEANNAGLANLEFIEGRTEEVLDGLAEAPDAVVLDPPRAGCHPNALQALVRRRPDRVIYVSCEPETLARDMSILAQGGFGVDSVEPVDMFPQTYHVECVATLSFRD